MSIFGRNFSTVVRGTEWISIHTNQITKRIIKRYGNLTNYLNSKFGKNNWRILYSANKILLKKEEIVKTIEKSFKSFYNENQEKINHWITSMSFNPLPEQIDELKKNKLLIDDLIIISEGFSNFCEETLPKKKELIE